MDLKLKKCYDEFEGEHYDPDFEEVCCLKQDFEEVLNGFTNIERYTLLNHFLKVMSIVEFKEEQIVYVQIEIYLVMFKGCLFGVYGLYVQRRG